MLRIVTDGTADLPEEWKEEYGIAVLPLRVRFGEEVFTAGVDMDEADFYRLVRERNQIPKTSLPSPGEVHAFYDHHAQPGDTILSLHVSRKLSGTLATVEMAANEIQHKYRVIPFDSGTGSIAIGLMCRAARILERAGKSIEQILDRLEDLRSRHMVIFTLDSLDFALMNGRVSAIQNMLTHALRVKPILILNEGVLDMADKVRTRQRSLERVVEIVRQRIGKMKVDLAVVHAADPDGASQMLDLVRGVFNHRDLMITSLAVPVAANLGPRAIGIVAVPTLED